MIEIGVSEGGSIELWRKYFGEDATIVGIDIDERCAERVSPPNHVRIGSQNDKAFLNSVIEEFGKPDIILDDGSHVAEHQRTTLDTLYPHLKVDGLYVIEDLHTAYWAKHFNGGLRRKGTALEVMKLLIDDLHHWYHAGAPSTGVLHDLSAVHIYDSIAIIEKCMPVAPKHIRVGRKMEKSA